MLREFMKKTDFLYAKFEPEYKISSEARMRILKCFAIVTMRICGETCHTSCV